MVHLHFTPSQKTWISSVFFLVAGAFTTGTGIMSLSVITPGWPSDPSWPASPSPTRCWSWPARLGGFGTAASLPSGVSLLGGTYVRPGRRKNLIFSIYGGCSPFGFCVGILTAGVAGQFLN
ncbi:uncharacterized protein PgNI_07796 [Pyricularia grisea]|uniref:Major facilitator superfamily (MFS) profile domain-containing protein n=1 Tax=Pyricularia grisea TaxID=148305 RepID=A0A6P8B1Z4_PYRGI|nr:uncharacterized protein PgNI_07796 [Pyricularia grisea]TLD08925.1 hypothetical protein PgNI_07796 [Pyricularia grisea]